MDSSFWVLTIFSASNYYEVGSNRGAYVKFIGRSKQPHFVQYMASKTHRKTTIRERKKERGKGCRGKKLLLFIPYFRSLDVISPILALFLVLTIFSASNYYEVGSNRGAYVKFIGRSKQPHFVQYMASKTHRKTTIRERSHKAILKDNRIKISYSDCNAVSLISRIVKIFTKQLLFYYRLNVVEESAVRELREKLGSFNNQLQNEFEKCDPRREGMISVHQWCECVERVTGLHLPWRVLAPKLSTLHSDGKHVLYNNIFAVVQVGNANQQVVIMLLLTKYKQLLSNKPYKISFVYI
ncbi:hypothetical protein DICVIV_07702 [Dictyocaulus viviparus]|uniref:EF-hand domain-containing protein n=1 Tax=Dictyocaulus viviparus TaxID=29172 RepID=A0A0D8XNM9_DICVI|nr:hypothetical protein DICVIV_07702 [Dictyocaulus viviparus]